MCVPSADIAPWVSLSLAGLVLMGSASPSSSECIIADREPRSAHCTHRWCPCWLAAHPGHQEWPSPTPNPEPLGCCLLSLSSSLCSPHSLTAAILGLWPLSLSALPLPALVVPRQPLLPQAETSPSHTPACFLQSPSPNSSPISMAGPGSTQKPWKMPEI